MFLQCTHIIYIFDECIILLCTRSVKAKHKEHTTQFQSKSLFYSQLLLKFQMIPPVPTKILVGISLNAEESKELLFWAINVLAQPNDTVVALHILGQYAFFYQNLGCLKCVNVYFFGLHSHA